MKRLIPFFIIMLLISCSSNLSYNNWVLHVSELPTGEFVKESGKRLISQPYGFTKIFCDSSEIKDHIVIAVHGYGSEGYEWIVPLHKLAENFDNTYFYRYDWNICPDILAIGLVDSISYLINRHSNINKIIIFGHSFGGLVATYLASDLGNNIPIEVHTIASPLAGYPRIMDNCNLEYNSDNVLIYSQWENNISHTQWRTQKQQDGAYRDMDYDPQVIHFDNSEIILLPETMDGERLGHNWSVTWVINNYIKNL